MKRFLLLTLVLLISVSMLGCSVPVQQLSEVQPIAHTPFDSPNVQKEKNDVAEESTTTRKAKGIFESFKPAIALQDTNLALAQERLHAIAQELGNGEPEWTEYYHLAGHSLLAQPPGEPEGTYLILEDAERYFKLSNKLFGETEDVQEQLEETQARLRWNKEGKEVKRQAEPIQFVIDWMKENARTEGEPVLRSYIDRLNERALPVFPLSESENWLTLEERVKIRYDSFFEALENLPADSITLQKLLGGSLESAQEHLLSEQAVIEAETPPSEPQQAPIHTWDKVH